MLAINALIHHQMTGTQEINWAKCGTSKKQYVGIEFQKELTLD